MQKERDEVLSTQLSDIQKLADIIEIDKNAYTIKPIELEWNTKTVINEIENRNMPDKDAIEEYFFNGGNAAT